jgi:glycerol-3-phosphate responsive antiterminator
MKKLELRAILRYEIFTLQIEKMQTKLLSVEAWYEFYKTQFRLIFGTAGDLLDFVFHVYNKYFNKAHAVLHVSFYFCFSETKQCCLRYHFELESTRGIISTKSDKRGGKLKINTATAAT